MFYENLAKTVATILERFGTLLEVHKKTTEYDTVNKEILSSSSQVEKFKGIKLENTAMKGYFDDLSDQDERNIKRKKIIVALEINNNALFQPDLKDMIIFNKEKFVILAKKIISPSGINIIGFFLLGK